MEGPLSRYTTPSYYLAENEKGRAVASAGFSWKTRERDTEGATVSNSDVN